MNENEISYAIRGAAFKIYSELGPGLFESVYEKLMAYELLKQGFEIKTQVGIPIRHKNSEFEVGFRADLIVNDLVIVEIKSVENLSEIHTKQLLTYLRLTGKKLGLLINFNTPNLKDSIKRIVNNL